MTCQNPVLNCALRCRETNDTAYERTVININCVSKKTQTKLFYSCTYEVSNYRLSPKGNSTKPLLLKRSLKQVIKTFNITLSRRENFIGLVT